MHIQIKSKKALILLILALFIVVLVTISWTVSNNVDTGKPSQAAASNCEKTGANIATYFNQHFDDVIYSKIEDINVHWVEAYALVDCNDPSYLDKTKWEVAKSIKNLRATGHDVVLRILANNCPDKNGLHQSGCCIGPGRSTSPDILAKYIKDLESIGATGFYFLVGHNEYNCSEYEDPSYEYQFMTELLQALKAEGVTSVKYLISQVDVMCGNRKYTDYLNAMRYKELESSGAFSGVAIATYNITGLPDFSTYVQNFYNEVHPSLPIFVTETGMMDQNIDRFKLNYDRVIGYNYVKAAFIFDTFFDNKEFDYHSTLSDINKVKQLSACFDSSSTGDGSGNSSGTSSNSRYSCSEVSLVVRFKINKKDGTDTGLFGSHHHDIPIRKIPLSQIKSIDLVVANTKGSNPGLYGEGITIYLRDETTNKTVKTFPNTSVATISDLLIFKDGHKYKVFIKMIDRNGKACSASNYFTFHGQVKPTTTPKPLPTGGTQAINFIVVSPNGGKSNKEIKLIVSGNTFTAKAKNGNVAFNIPISLLDATGAQIVGNGHMAVTFKDKLRNLNGKTITLGKFGDLNGDNVINTADYAIFVKCYKNKEVCADADGSGEVWVKDYSILINNLNGSSQDAQT